MANMMLSTLTSLDTRRARRMLASNAAFSGACALPMILASGDIAQALLGNDEWSTIVTSVGVALLGYVAVLLFARSQPTAKMRRWLLGFSAADALWVVGTVVLLVMLPAAFTPAGLVTAALIAVFVGWFGLNQLRLGLAR
jgi:hypothetical protein